MKKNRFSEEQIIEVLKQLEAGRKVSELSREYGGVDGWHLRLEVEVRRGREVGQAEAAQRTRRREPPGSRCWRPT